MVPLQEAKFILKPAHSLLGVHVLFLRLYAELRLKFCVLFLKNLEDVLFVFQFYL